MTVIDCGNSFNDSGVMVVFRDAGNDGGGGGGGRIGKGE